MIRRSPPPASTPAPLDTIDELRARLLSRRRFLITAAGGSVALLFGLQAATAEPSSDVAADPWPTLDAVLQHLLPSEPDSPGAAEINATAYLRFVVGDPRVDRDEREFIVQGVSWLDDLAGQQHGAGFVTLNETDRESLLRQIARSDAGENWLSTLLSYLLEALLTAPAYGGNPDGVGWRWLQYVPGFPLPTKGRSRYMELPP